MRKILALLAFVLVIVLASCSINVNNSESSYTHSDSKIVYGKFNGYEILEHRLLVGYENKDAALKLAEKLGGKIYEEIPQIKVVAIKIPMKVSEAFKTLKALKFSGIRYVEPSYRRYIIDPNPSSDSITRSTRSDSEEDFWNELWGLQKINAQEAWKEATGVGVTVAVVDTPIDCQHPDLSGQCVEGFDPASNTIIPPTADYEDPQNPGDDHGTHVSGTIAAKNDGKGVVGLAYGAKIMSIVIFKGTADHSGYYYVGDENTAKGIIWAVDHGAKVLSNSWGGPGYSYTLKAAVDYALSHGAVFVAAAGNDHTDQHWHYPSAYPGVLAVGATNARDEVADFSSRGEYVSVAAPGVNILSTIPHLAKYGIYGKPYDYWAGTSMATPHVSALAALLLQKYPKATPYQIMKMIEKSAVDIDKPGWDHSAGYGRIDAAKALEESPEGDGAIYHVKVISKDAKFAISSALVTLKRKDGDGPSYYAASDKSGVASFYYIDPADYDVIVGGPDLYDINSPILRMEEQTTDNYSTSLESGESTDTVKFDTYVDFQFDIGASSTAYLIYPYYYYKEGVIYPLIEATSSEATTVTVEMRAGQAIAMYAVSDPVDSTTTVWATAIVNDEVLPIYGKISQGSTYTFLDEYGGGNSPAWWTAF